MGNTGISEIGGSCRGASVSFLSCSAFQGRLLPGPTGVSCPAASL